MKQLLIITAGTTGSGKSTVAEAVTRSWPVFRHVEIDAVRKQLAGLPINARVTTKALHRELYSPSMSEGSYAELYRRAQQCLECGHSVVLDAAFRTPRRRAAALSIGRLNKVPTLIIECSLERAEQLRRLERRYAKGGSTSDARPDVLVYHEGGWMMVDDCEAECLLRLDTRRPLSLIRGEILETIERLT
jgi:predicted kinase